MPYINDVDCDHCRYKSDISYCDDCVHSYEDFDDHFEKMSEEELKERKELQLQKFKESLVGEKVEINLSDEFKRAFNLAHNFTSRKEHNPEYWGVYCDKYFLMATDGDTLANIKVTVPESLVGKNLIKYDHEEIFLAKTQNPVFKNGEAERILREAWAGADATVNVPINKSLADIINKYDDPVVNDLVQIKDGPIVKKTFLDYALEAIEENEDFTISYQTKDKFKPILIQSRIIECLIMPVRVDF